MHHIFKFLLLAVCLCGVSVFSSPAPENSLAEAVPRGISSSVVPTALLDRSVSDVTLGANLHSSLKKIDKTTTHKKPINNKKTKKTKLSKKVIIVIAVIVVLVIVLVLSVVGCVICRSRRQAKKRAALNESMPQGPSMQGPYPAAQ